MRTEILVHTWGEGVKVVWWPVAGLVRELAQSDQVNWSPLLEGKGSILYGTIFTSDTWCQFGGWLSGWGWGCFLHALVCWFSHPLSGKGLVSCAFQKSQRFSHALILVQKVQNLLLSVPVSSRAATLVINPLNAQQLNIQSATRCVFPVSLLFMVLLKR